MPGDRVFMCWEDHHDVLVSALRNHLSNSALADCTLAAEGQYIKAHKLILSACSPYFQMLFSEVGDKHPIVVLKDVKYHHLKGVLDYVYSGKVKISEHEIRTFQETMRCLQIEGLQSGGTGDNYERRAENEILSISGSQNCPRRNENTSEENMSRENDSEEAGDQVGNSQMNTDTEGTTIIIENIHSEAPKIDQTISEDEFVSRENSIVDLAEAADYSGVDNDITAMEVVANEEIVENVCVSLPCSNDQSANTCVSDQVNSKPKLAKAGSGLQSEQTSIISADQIGEGNLIGFVVAVGKRNCRFADASATSEIVLAASHLRQEDSGAVSDSSPGPDNIEYVATENARRKCPRRKLNFQLQHKRSRDQSVRPRAVNNMSHNLRELEEKLHACQECSKAFRSASALCKHVRVQHRANRVYRCDLCNVTFQLPSDFKIHMRMHMPERPFLCELCSATFKQSSHLTNHMRKHTGERPYQCEVCSAVFGHRIVLTRHMRKHTGERPFQCGVCNATFTQNGHLTTHMRSHTGEKPYPCKNCGKCFSRKFALVLHTRTHTCAESAGKTAHKNLNS